MAATTSSASILPAGQSRQRAIQREQHLLMQVTWRRLWKDLPAFRALATPDVQTGLATADQLLLVFVSHWKQVKCILPSYHNRLYHLGGSEWKLSQDPSSCKWSCWNWGRGGARQESSHPSFSGRCKLPHCHLFQRGPTLRWLGNENFAQAIWITCWLNSQLVDGEPLMTTRLVLGTSRPIDPADVDSKVRTDLQYTSSLSTNFL